MNVIRVSLIDINKINFDLGYVGEKNHTKVVINCASIFRDYPDAVATMVAKPPHGDLYPINLTKDGTTITWEVTESDIAYAGSGQYQLTFTDGTGDDAEIIKTVYGQYSIKPSLTSTGEPPEPLEDWLQEATAALETFETEIGEVNRITTASPSDVGKALSPKTVSGGKVTEWQYINLADPDVVTEAVDAWLDDHPEATTTVEDGAITEPKLNDSLKSALAWQTDVDDVKSAFITEEEKRLPFFVVKDQYVKTDGSIEAYYGWNRTEYIPLEGIYAIYPKMTASSNYNCFYNASKQPISSPSFYVATTEVERIIPQDAKYVMFSNSASGLSGLEVRYVTKDEHENSVAHANIQATLDYLLDDGIKSRDITSFVSNETTYFLESAKVPYYDGDTFRQATIVGNMKPYVEVGTDYILYCGRVNVPSTTGIIRLYFECSDESYGYIDVKQETRFKHFKFDSSKTLTKLELRGIPVNGGSAVVGDGNAIFSNIYIFKGETLHLRDIFGNNDIWTNVPVYYKDQLATKEATIRAHKKDCAFNGDALVFLTDTHFKMNYFLNNDISQNEYNANHSIPLINHIIENTAVPWVFFGGDLVHTTENVDDMIHCINIFGSAFGDSKDRLAYCVGNHEYFTDNGQGVAYRPTANWLYGGFVKYNENRIEGKTDMDTYYFDNKIQKIRYFIIGCGRDTESSNTQIAWIMDQFSKVPENYKIICVGHAFLADTMDAFRGNFGKVMEAMDAVNSRITYTFNGITYDYSVLNNVEAVCAITGHTHIDGDISSEGGVPCIGVTCDSYEQNYEIQGGTPVNVPRTINTVDEQAFDVIQFDFSNKKIYCTRIGYGADREFSYGA